jgi:hypothetical protein
VVRAGTAARVVLAGAPAELDFCEARLPVTDGGFVRTRWQKSSEGVRAETELPAGYRLEQG